MTKAEAPLIVLVLAVIAGGLYWWLQPSQYDEAAEIFQPHIQRFIDSWRKAETRGDTRDLSEAFLEKKAIAIDLRQARLARMHMMLPDKVRARTPADVKSIVIVDCKMDKVGNYGFMSDAYSEYCRLHVLNLSNNILFRLGGITNSPPQRVQFPIPFKDVFGEVSKTRQADWLLGSVLIR